ncbi:hypothetical protein Tco_1267782 [Tanacetum coccineum]
MMVSIDEDVEKSLLADQDDVGSGVYPAKIKSLKKNDVLDMLVPRMLRFAPIPNMILYSVVAACYSLFKLIRDVKSEAWSSDFAAGVNIVSGMFNDDTVGIERLEKTGTGGNIGGKPLKSILKKSSYRPLSACVDAAANTDMESAGCRPIGAATTGETNGSTNAVGGKTNDSTAGHQPMGSNIANFSTKADVNG